MMYKPLFHISLVHLPEPECAKQFLVVLIRCGASEKNVYTDALHKD